VLDSLVYRVVILNNNNSAKNEIILKVKAVLRRVLDISPFDFSLKTIGANPKSIILAIT
jgi:hypothetical protein